MITAKVVAASKHYTTNMEVATLKVTMPRYILAELNTHRMFSRNSASSRAIPANRMLKNVTENIFTPMAWMKDHSGMQGTNYFEETREISFNNSTWKLALDYTLPIAQELNGVGVTKQMTNRLLEPFMWHTVLITATEWQNFLIQRCPRYEFSYNGHAVRYFSSKKEYITHWEEVMGLKWQPAFTQLDWLKLNKGAADIHMRELAEVIYDALKETEYKTLYENDWHMPFGDQIDEQLLIEAIKTVFPNSLEVNDYITPAQLQTARRMISVARCARLSYETFGDDPKIDLVADLKLYHKLAVDLHLSPFEHVCKAMNTHEWQNCVKTVYKNGEFVPENGWFNNFRGFIQERAYLQN